MGKTGTASCVWVRQVFNAKLIEIVQEVWWTLHFQFPSKIFCRKNFECLQIKLMEVQNPRSKVWIPGPKVRSLKTEVRSRKSEVGSRKSEVRSPKSEVRSPKSGRPKSRNYYTISLKKYIYCHPLKLVYNVHSEWIKWSQKPEVWSLKSEVWSPKSEVRSPKSEVRSPKSEV